MRVYIVIGIKFRQLVQKEFCDMEEYWTAMDALQEGEIGVVRRIGLEGTIARRLRELGLIVGTKVRCLQKSPAGTRWPMESAGQ